MNSGGKEHVLNGAHSGSGEIPALLLAGGRPRDPGAMARMMSRAFQGLSKPQVAYIGTANGDNPAFFQMMKAMLIRAGAGKVVFVRLAKAKPDLDAARKTLSGAEAVFLSGGEVEDGVLWLVKHNLMEYLKELYHNGKRFIGVSAGTIMMGAHWVRWETPGDDATSSLFGCLGLIPVLFDTHGEDEDWVELKAALKLLGDGARGYGLPGGSMISADSRGTLVNLEREYLTFINEGGHIRIYETQ